MHYYRFQLIYPNFNKNKKHTQKKKVGTQYSDLMNSSICLYHAVVSFFSSTCEYRNFLNFFSFLCRVVQSFKGVDMSKNVDNRIQKNLQISEVTMAILGIFPFNIVFLGSFLAVVDVDVLFTLQVHSILKLRRK